MRWSGRRCPRRSPPAATAGWSRPACRRSTCRSVSDSCKPDPEIYLAVAERFGLPPQATVVLEDSQNGCLAASVAGAYTVAVPGDHSRDQDFSCASLVVESLADHRLYEALELD